MAITVETKEQQRKFLYDLISGISDNYPSFFAMPVNYQMQANYLKRNIFQKMM